MPGDDDLRDCEPTLDPAKLFLISGDGLGRFARLLLRGAGGQQGIVEIVERGEHGGYRIDLIMALLRSQAATTDYGRALTIHPASWCRSSHSRAHPVPPIDELCWDPSQLPAAIRQSKRLE